MRFNSDAAIDLVLRGIIGFTRLFGYCTRVKLFGFIASYVVAPVFGYIKKAVRNLQLVHPDMSTREARKIAHEVATNFGKNMIENYNKHDVAAALKPENIGGAGYDQMMVAIAEGRPVMLVSGHIGNYEAMRIALYTLGHQSACLFRPAKIAMKTGALFVPCFTHRGPDGMTHHIDFETPIEHSTSYEMMAEMSDRLEAQVRRFPAQWLWFHDRWGTADMRAQRAADNVPTIATGGKTADLNTTNDKDY